jgi:hypothetical protein
VDYNNMTLLANAMEKEDSSEEDEEVLEKAYQKIDKKQLDKKMYLGKVQTDASGTRTPDTQYCRLDDTHEVNDHHGRTRETFTSNGSSVARSLQGYFSSVPTSLVLGGTVMDDFLRSDAKADRQFPCGLFLDAYSKLADIHARSRYADIKELSGCGLFEEKLPLLVSLRRREHCLPVRATEFNRYSACRLVCSANKNMTGQRATHGDFFLHDTRSRVSGPQSEEENQR